MLDMAGKKVIIVGGTSGINRGIALSFAQQGAMVAVASRSQDKVDKTMTALRTHTDHVLGFSADVRDSEAITKGIAGVYEQWGSIDVLVSGAAGNFPAKAMGMSANAFKSVVDIDLLGTFNVLQGAYPYLSKPGASIINISAPQAFVPMVGQSHVCAAKAGVDMLTRSLALEWGSDGIRVNSLVPGPIAGTEGMQRLAPTPELTEATRHTIPLKRLGTPDDIGNACLFLSSPMASYISGVILPVDGGWSLAGASSVSALLDNSL